MVFFTSSFGKLKLNDSDSDSCHGATSLSRQWRSEISQELEWYPIKTFFDLKADKAAKSKLRTVGQKRAWLEKKGFKIQKERD